MTDEVTNPPKQKISKRALQQIRRATAMNASGSYGIGGLLRQNRRAPITLRLPKDKR